LPIFAIPVFHAFNAASLVFTAQSASALLLWLNHINAKILGNLEGMSLNMSVIHWALLPPCSEEENSAMKRGFDEIESALYAGVKTSVKLCHLDQLCVVPQL